MFFLFTISLLSSSFLYIFKSLFDLSLLFLFARKFSVLQCNCMS
jgi:hypothetical protein